MKVSEIMTKNPICCCGIVALADIARKCGLAVTSEVVREISQPIAA